MSKRFGSFIESALAISALVAIVIVSTAAVIALNPGVYEGSSQEGNVAGLSGDENTALEKKLPFVIENLDASGNLHYEEAGSTYLFSKTVTLNNGNKLNSKFVKVTNSNNSDAKLFVKSNLQVGSNTTSHITIRLIDQLDTITLVEGDKGSIERFVTIPKNTSRIFELEFESDITINFPLTIEIEMR